MKKRKVISRVGTLALAGSLLGGCAAFDKISNITNPPPLSPVNNPMTTAGYRPVSMPMPEPLPVAYSPNSLWRSGSRAFFKDQRAHQIGDILTIKVKIADKAQLDNETKRERKADEDSGITNLFGLTKIPFTKQAIPNRLLTTDSTTNNEGKGNINRQEILQTNVAAVVTQVLPNGNLVIEGKQEVRVNFEMRELIVAGIVRPEDIEADNTMDSQKIAQARISYGGRGQITDIQQPRWGQQFFEHILPF
jgi:flagellar L-ring protein precursor FlgH